MAHRELAISRCSLSLLKNRTIKHCTKVIGSNKRRGFCVKLQDSLTLDAPDIRPLPEFRKPLGKFTEKKTTQSY